MKHGTWLRWAVIAAGGVLALVIAISVPLPQSDFARWSVQSLRIVDRNGIVLREFPNDQEGRGEWKEINQISPSLQMATIAVEDKRFRHHPGVDPIAVARSIVDNLRAMRFRSGGSTLTQQVIRNVYHRSRTIPSKLLEMWDALRLERMTSKQDILVQYLNRAPYGNQLFGVEAASRWYFGKPASDVSLAEAAFLAALPNSPSTLNPHKNFTAAISRQRDVLLRLLVQQKVSREEYDRAIAQPIQIIPPEAHFKAPHVAEMIAAMEPATGTVQTTIDYPLQVEAQWTMRNHLARLHGRNVHNAAAVVIDNGTGEIRALVGSADFFDSTHGGQVNGALARRQPGSAIKPFMYALALEHGFTPATLLADIPTAIPDHHGDYVPENYDRRYHGPVRLRTALACSYNVPAVRTLQKIGKAIFLEKLKDVGISSLDEDAEFYGYGLTLGNAEVSLLELATAYMSIANGGKWKPAHLLLAGNNVVSAHRVYDDAAAYLITDILKDGVARRPAFGGNFHFPFQCAVKTGTTKDYKDNWTLGYTTRYTVGVWVGNFDGSQMRQVSGVTGAGPIFTDIMMYLHSAPYGDLPPDFTIPDHLVQQSVCARSGKLPTEWCKKTVNELFIEGEVPTEKCDIHQGFLVQEAGRGRKKRVYEIYPPEYRSWAANEGVPSPPPDARRAGRQFESEEHVRSLMIVSPNPGDYFKIDPVLRPEYQKILISGFVPQGLTEVVLRINGAQEIAFGPGGVEWQLQKGVFRFQLRGLARNAQVLSAPVTINVE